MSNSLREIAGPAPTRPTHSGIRRPLLLALVVLVAAGLRFFDLGRWPVFSDEDWFTWVVYEMAHLPIDQAILRSATAVLKPPLPFLLQEGLAGITGDPLIAGRVMSAAAGSFTTLLVFFLGRRLGAGGVGLVAAAIYALSPLAILHERMALHDGPLTALALSAALTSWTAIERKSWALAFLAMLLGALTVQMKPSGLAVAILPGLLLATVGPSWARAGVAAIATIGPAASYLALRFGPLSIGIAQQETERLNVMGSLGANAEALRDATLTYLPMGLPLLVPVGFALLWRRSPRLAFTIFMAIAGAILPWLVLSNFAPSREYLPTLPYVSALAAVAIVRALSLARSIGRPATMALATAFLSVIGASGLASANLVFDQSTAPMSKVDDVQYRTGGWPTGYGYGDAARLVLDTAPDGSYLAFAVDPWHRIAVGLHRPLPIGLTPLGLFGPNDKIPILSGPMYVIAADGPGEQPGERVQRLRGADPELRPLAYFPQPGSRWGVSVLYAPRRSAEPQVALRATFGQTIEALGYDLRRLVRPGDAIDLTIYSRLTRSLDDARQWRMLARLADGDGARTLSTSTDEEVLPKRLRAGDVVISRFRLPVPNSIAPGVYQVTLGMLNRETKQSIDAVDSRGASVNPMISLLPVRVLGAPQPAKPSRVISKVFGDGIGLLGYDLLPEPSSSTLVLRLHWNAEDVPRHDYTVFTHLLEDGKVVAQQDNQPQNGKLPTSLWERGEWVVDEYRLPIPDRRDAGVQLEVGLYRPETGQRLRLKAADGAPGQDHVLLPLELPQ